MAVQDYELLLRVRADLLEAISGLKGLSTSLGETQAQVTATGASADVAAGSMDKLAASRVGAFTSPAGDPERIKAMVQASLAAADADKAQLVAERELTGGITGRAAATDAAVASSRASAVAAAATRTAVTAQIADYGILDAVLEKKVRTDAEVATGVAALNRLRVADGLSTSELASAVERLNLVVNADTGALEVNTAANVENAAAKDVNSRTSYSISALFTDAATGNMSRARREVAALANESGLLGKIMSPVGLAIAGVVAVIVGFAAALVSGEKETAKFNTALQTTGNFSATTAAQLEDVVTRVGGATGSYGKASDALAALTTTGKYTSAELEQLTQASVDFATVTGGKVTDGVKALGDLFGNAAKGAAKLNDQYHFLTTTQLDEIQKLQDEGKEDQAREVAQRAFGDAVHQRALDVQASAGIMSRAWESVTTAASKAWHQMQGIGEAQSVSAQAKSVLDQLNALTAAGPFGGPSQNPRDQAASVAEFNSQKAALQAQLHSLQGQLASQGLQQTGEAIANNATAKSSAAAQSLEKFAAPIDKLNSSLQKAGKNLDDYLLGTHSPEAVAKAYRAFYNEIDQAQSAYASSQKKTKAGRKNSGLAVDHAQLAADVAAVQNALALIQNAYQNSDKVLEAQHKAGQISDQAYYDGLKADLDKYVTDKTAALEQEKTAAQSHVKTQQDRIRADQAVAKIDTQITQLHADAAAKSEEIDAREKQSIDASRQAWDALRRSFETPAEVRAEDAIAQIAKLNKMLANGVITAEQYHDSLAKIGQKSVAKALPTYRGVGAAVGGPFGELSKNYAAQTALDKAYQDSLLALKDKFRDTDEAHQEAYQAALLQLDRDHAAKSAAIEQARGQLLLTASADLFGQLATLSTSKNSKVAAIGKAAAIAQTLIKTYQSAESAFAAGVAIGGPAALVLGTAFAAVAVATGLANVAQIRAQSVGGYSEGGYTGTGGRHEVAGVVHAGEVVFSQDDVLRAGGVSAVEMVRLRGYAAGGLVKPFPASASFLPVSRRPEPTINANARNSGSGNAAPTVGVRIVNSVDPQFVTDNMNSPSGEAVILNVIARNQSRVKQMVR